MAEQKALKSGVDGVATEMAVDDVLPVVNVPEMGAASAGTAGTAGAVPAPSAGDQQKFLRADKTWASAGASAGVPTGGTTDQVLAKIDGADYNTQWVEPSGGTSYVHPNHTGDVTSVGDAAQTIVNKQTLTASNGVNVSNSPTVIAGAAPAISLTYGSTANTVCQGNDSRLSDARTPIAHTQTASTITDFSTSVAGNSAVAANTSKVTNAMHTGDVTGSAALTIANNAVTYAKMQDVSATDKLLGRLTAGAGDPEEIPCTAFGRSLIDDTDAATSRATLGLGNSATKNTGTGSGDVAAGDHPHPIATTAFTMALIF